MVIQFNGLKILNILPSTKHRSKHVWISASINIFFSIQIVKT